MNINYGQLFLLAIFAIVLTIRYLISLKEKIKPIIIFKKEKNFSEKIIEIAPIIAVILATFLVLRKIFTPQICSFLSFGYTPPFWLQLIGFFISLFSFILLISGYYYLGNNWRVGVDDESIDKLVTNGIFAYTRNPIYLFFNLFWLGIFIINGDIILFFLFVVLSITLHLLILKEEEFLERKFRDLYTNYKQSTPRYF